MPATVRLEATVRGVVQGVGFRWFVVREAQGRDLTGWVANEHDGSVRVVAEGAPAAIASFRAALRGRAAGAVVERVSAVEMPATGSLAALRGPIGAITRATEANAFAAPLV